MTPLGEAALELAALGFRVFPCVVGDKKPFIAEWQKRATTDENLIRGWWETTDHNIGLATGADSGVIVLDWDGPPGYGTRNMLQAKHGNLPVTVTAATGKGAHEYYRYPSGLDVRNRQNQPLMPGFDLRGNGGYVLAPPSLHPSGKRYAWKRDPWDWDLQDLPDEFVELIHRPPAASSWGAPSNWKSFLDEVVEGSERHARCARLWGYLIQRETDPSFGFSMVRMFNDAKCRPPLPEEELQRLADDIAKREKAKVENGRGRHR